ncbi:hypothetical protein DFS34DRAFT_614643 [Phlyctochytrium arcticum]|nr:hypothetical protein DFS34DRAFT_614643 [Phlyctochytrium arcticum]
MRNRGTARMERKNRGMMAVWMLLLVALLGLAHPVAAGGGAPKAPPAPAPGTTVIDIPPPASSVPLPTVLPTFPTLSLPTVLPTVLPTILPTTPLPTTVIITPTPTPTPTPLPTTVIQTTIVTTVTSTADRTSTSATARPSITAPAKSENSTNIPRTVGIAGGVVGGFLLILLALTLLVRSSKRAAAKLDGPSANRMSTLAALKRTISRNRRTAAAHAANQAGTSGVPKWEQIYAPSPNPLANSGAETTEYYGQPYQQQQPHPQAQQQQPYPSYDYYGQQPYASNGYANTGYPPPQQPAATYAPYDQSGYSAAAGYGGYYGSAEYTQPPAHQHNGYVTTDPLRITTSPTVSGDNRSPPPPPVKDMPSPTSPTPIAPARTVVIPRGSPISPTSTSSFRDTNPNDLRPPSP